MNLKEGKSIALVSDAGMPSICDPGEKIVKVKSNLKDMMLFASLGACAAITALVSSGMPSSKFIFEGFLPKKIDREKILLKLVRMRKQLYL